MHREGFDYRVLRASGEIEESILRRLWGKEADLDKAENSAPVLSITRPRIFLCAWWVFFFPTPVFLLFMMGWLPAAVPLLAGLFDDDRALFFGLFGFLEALLIDYVLAVWALKYFTRRWIVRLAALVFIAGWFNIYFVGDVGGGRQWFGWGKMLFSVHYGR